MAKPRCVHSALSAIATRISKKRAAQCKFSLPAQSASKESELLLVLAFLLLALSANALCQLFLVRLYLAGNALLV